MQTNNREDEPETQNQHNDGIHTQTGALISVKLQHRTGGATSASRACRAGSGIAQGLLVIGGRATAQRSARTTRGSGRRGTVDAGARGGGGAGARGLVVGTGFGAGGERGGCAGGGL